MRFDRFCCCLVLLLAAVPLFAADDADSILLSSGYSRPGDDGSPVFRIGADGSIEPIGLAVDEWGGGIEHGIRGSVPSPDGKRLAFTRDGDLWVYETQGDRVRPLTWVGKPMEPPLASIFVAIKAWSGDSRRIVYHVGHGLQDMVGCDGPAEPTEVREAAYGFYEVDVESGESRPLDETKDILDCFRKHHVAWLPDGSLLVHGDLAGPDTRVRDLCPKDANDKYTMRAAYLHRVSPDGESIRLVAELEGWFGQPSLSADARLLAVHHAVKAESEKKWSVQLLKLDLESGAVEPITERSPWASRQLAKLSPSGRRVAYIRTEHAGGEQTAILTVDGKDVASESPFLSHFWIGETALAIRTNEMLRVIDADTGEELGRRSLVPTKD